MRHHANSYSDNTELNENDTGTYFISTFVKHDTACLKNTNNI